MRVVNDWERVFRGVCVSSCHIGGDLAHNISQADCVRLFDGERRSSWTCQSYWRGKATLSFICEGKRADRMPSMSAYNEFIATEALIRMNCIFVVLNCLTISPERLSMSLVQIGLCHGCVIASSTRLLSFIRFQCLLHIWWNPADAIFLYHLFGRRVIDVALFEHWFQNAITVRLWG